jgi:hypothetical protein
MRVSVEGACCLSLVAGVGRHDYTTWVIIISVQQLVGLQDSSTSNVVATTWQLVKSGVGDTSYGNDVQGLVRVFVKEFDAASPGRHL